MLLTHESLDVIVTSPRSPVGFDGAGPVVTVVSPRSPVGFDGAGPVVTVVSPRSPVGFDGAGPVVTVVSPRSPVGRDGGDVLDVQERFGTTVVFDVTCVLRSPFEFVVVCVTRVVDVSD